MGNDKTEGDQQQLSPDAETAVAKAAVAILLLAAFGIYGLMTWFHRGEMAKSESEPVECPSGQDYSESWNNGFGAIQKGVTIYTGWGQCKDSFGQVESVDLQAGTAMVDRGAGAVQMDLDVLHKGGYFSP